MDIVFPPPPNQPPPFPGSDDGQLHPPDPGFNTPCLLAIGITVIAGIVQILTF